MLLHGAWSEPICTLDWAFYLFWQEAPLVGLGFSLFFFLWSPSPASLRDVLNSFSLWLGNNTNDCASLSKRQSVRTTYVGTGLLRKQVSKRLFLALYGTGNFPWKRHKKWTCGYFLQLVGLISKFSKMFLGVRFLPRDWNATGYFSSNICRGGNKNLFIRHQNYANICTSIQELISLSGIVSVEVADPFCRPLIPEVGRA